MKFLNALSSLLLFFPLFGLLADGDGGGGGQGSGDGAGAAGGAQGGGAGAGSGAGAGGAGAGAAGGGNAGAAGGSSSGDGSGGTQPPANFRDFIGADGKFVKGWAKSLGGSDALEAKFTDPKALIGSYGNLEKLISAKGIIKPGPNATPEEKAAYLNALGRPAKPEEYGFTTKPNSIMIDGKEVEVPVEIFDAKIAGEYQTLAHELGLSKEQATALMNFDLKRGTVAKGNFDKMMTEGRTASEKALKEAWGDNYQAEVKTAADAALKAGMTQEEMTAHPELANSPIFLRIMNKVGSMILEKPTAGARSGGNDGGFTNPQAQIDAIVADKNHPYYSKVNDKAHKDAVAHVFNLRKAAQAARGGKK